MRYLRKALSVFCIVCALNLNAQGTVLDKQDAFGALFRQSVKSCDEFMCRFNEEEFFPDLDANDPQLGLKNFMLLFDYQLVNKKGKEKFIEETNHFYETIKKGKIKLTFESRNWYAELRTNFLHEKSNVELGIILQPEKTPKGLWCWTIVGVNGLEKVGFADSTKRMVISPEQNESEFMEIESDFKFSSKQFSQFRSYNKKLEALSYFFALVESGKLTFKSRVSTTYHFFDVPSYAFSVRYHDRKKSNTGWLIFDYKKLTKEEKNSKLQKLLSK